MRGRRSSDRSHGTDAAPRRTLELDAPGVPAGAGSRARRRADRWRVWAPIALRALALGIALLGLAGIGSAMGRTPAPLAARAGVSHAELGLGALPARALAVVTSAGSPPLAQAVAPLGGVAPAGALADAGEPASREAADAPASPCPEGARARPSAAASGAPVVLNRADAAELQRLPGVGAKRAEAIIALRARLGRFRRPGDLLRIKGIGPRTLERMLPHLVLD
ncbi:MAG TPA: helix-hairpin-helix domain-containing protein [Polyangiaceae bacterium]|nr:helix-hairpin-helix domain-containing protein [Polyangiaceae bacterium]